MIKNPSASRNSGAILEVLKKELDTETPNMRLLEVSSGTGQHITYFSSRFPNIKFQPSEFNEGMFDSIRAYTQNFQSKNISDPIKIDITTPYYEWGVDDSGVNFEDLEGKFDYVLNINMIHISPIECTEGLFRNTSKLLKEGGRLFTYGPYGENGKISPESNVNFDKMLKNQDPRWGVRDLNELQEMADSFGIECSKIYDLPANNKCVIWTRL